MKSPFPGMDPYLEAHWLDVHNSLIFLSKSAIQSQLSDDLVARSEERLVVESAGGVSHLIGPDVRVVEHGMPGEPVRPAGNVAVAEPLVFEMESEPVVQRYLEIIDVSTGGKVVTIIEFLSPSNKLPGDGRAKYQRKQQECREAGVNLVEIDLTRTGQRELLAQRWVGVPGHSSTYQASVWRAAQPGRVGLYTMRLQEALPAIRIPLRATDADAGLDLQAVVAAAYAASRFDRTIDYAQACAPPLDSSEATWAAELLKSAGRR